MSAIGFVVRDGMGSVESGLVAGEGGQSSILLGAGADASLNLTSGQIVSYTRSGQALEVTLLDGRVILIEGFFTPEGVAENRLFLSADGFLTEVQLNAGAGADYYAIYLEGDGMGKFAMNDDLYFMRSADVMLADAYVQSDDSVGMLGAALGGIGPLFGLGGAGAAAVLGGAALISGDGGDGGGGGGGGGPVAPTVTVTTGTEAVNHIVNEEDHASGVVIGGEGTPGATVEVTVGDTTQTTTVDEAGTWEVTFDPETIETGEYQTPVEVVITNEGGSTSVADTLVVDTVIGVTFDATGGDDGVINAVEHAGGTTLTGAVTGGDAVVVTIGGIAYNAVVSGEAWALDVPADVLVAGEYGLDIVVTATDAAGNSRSTQGTIVVDTVTSVTVDTASVGGSDSVVNAVEHSAGVTLTGTAEAGASVSVTFGAITKTVIASPSGTWSQGFSSSEVPTGEVNVPVSVTSTDMAGNTATASGSVTVDTFVNNLEITSGPIGGADAVLNFNESAQAITMTGTVEAGSSVSINLHGIVRAASVDANGNWTVSYPGGSLPGGEYDTSVTVTATDAAGNTSALTEAVRVDTVAGELALSSQPIEIDNIVNLVERSDGVVISGTATPGMLVTVGLGDARLTVTSSPAGTWDINFPAHLIPQGTYDAPIMASITDPAGNYREVNSSVLIDTEVENFAFSPEPIAGDNVINAAESAQGVTLSGTVEANSSVVVEFGGQSRTVSAGADGLWSADFPSSAIPAGEYMSSIRATATDHAGNIEVITSSVRVDTFVNRLTSDDPVAGDNIVNAAEAAEGVTLSGTVEAGSTVMVTFERTERAATVDAAGNWSVFYAASEIPAGEYDTTVTIHATDAYGNTAEISDTFHVDTVAPTAPGIESVTTKAGGVEYIGIESTSNGVTVSEVSSSGTVTQLATEHDGASLPWGETLFNFDGALPNGSHLVVNETDVAGNANATYLVLEEAGTNAVSLTGLEGFDVGAIDLRFAKDSEVTLDLATLQGLSDANNNLIIHGGDDDFVTLAGATASGSTAEIGGRTYNVYTLGDDAQVFIDESINVTI